MEGRVTFCGCFFKLPRFAQKVSRSFLKLPAVTFAMDMLVNESWENCWVMTAETKKQKAGSEVSKFSNQSPSTPCCFKLYKIVQADT